MVNITGIIKIFNRELKLMSLSIQYLVTWLVFLVIGSYIFHSINIMLGYISGTAFFRELTRVSIFFIPFITMNTLAKDRLTGELELISAAGYKPLEIVMGKFKAGQVLIFFMAVYYLFLPLVYAVFGLLASDFDYSVYLPGLCGFIFIFSLYNAVGLFFSSCNKHPALAGGLTFSLLLVLFFLETLPIFFPGSNLLRVIVNGLPYFRAEKMMLGVINAGDLGYFIVLISLFLILSTLSVKWKKY